MEENSGGVDVPIYSVPTPMELGDVEEDDEPRVHPNNGIALPLEKLVMEEPIVPMAVTQVGNQAGGVSHKLCDIHRLKRFLVMGCEEGSTYDTTRKCAFENLMCLERLLKNRCQEAVLQILVEYSRGGRCVRDTPLLTVLALCAERQFPETNFDEIRTATYKRVPEICTMPTRLFQFVKLSNNEIEDRRKIEPPEPQKRRSKKPNKKRACQSDLKEDHNVSRLKPVHCDGRKSAGWGRMRRRCIAKFYEDEGIDACRLAYLGTKYRKRHHYKQKELLKYAHPRIDNEEKNWVLKYLSGGIKRVREKKDELQNPISENVSEVINFIEVIDLVRGLSPTTDGDEERLLDILDKYGKRGKTKEAATATTMEGDEPPQHAEWQKSPIQIVREHIPTGFLKSKRVWEALLVDMPLTAMIWNIGKMASIKLFDDELMLNQVLEKLTNEPKLKGAKVHPLRILIAKSQYEKGHGDQGKLRWRVDDRIVEAFDVAFRSSFRCAGIYRTRKKYMLCLNVSSVMSKPKGCSGCKSLTAAQASCAMAWVTWNIEEHVKIVAFGGGGRLIDLETVGFHKNMGLGDALKEIEKIDLGVTDCSLPMKYAIENNLDIDVFIIYSDSQPCQLGGDEATELRNYNDLKNGNAKLIVCGMDSSGFTVADPDDPNMLDIVGFDMHVPELIREFALGNLSGLCGEECYECKGRRQR